MGKTKQSSSKFVEKKSKNVQTKFKKSVKQQEKIKPSKPNKAAELIEQKERAKIEKQHKIAEYKKKRLERTKVISKKTSRGQPLMKNRIEYLLKQIQEMKRS